VLVGLAMLGMGLAFLGTPDSHFASSSGMATIFGFFAFVAIFFAIVVLKISRQSADRPAEPSAEQHTDDAA